MATDTQPVVGNDATKVALKIEGQRRDPGKDFESFVASNNNAAGTTIDLSKGDTITGLAADRAMKIDIRVDMTKPSAITGTPVPSSWSYELPFRYDEIADGSKTVVRYPSDTSATEQARMQIVPGCGGDGKAYIRVDFNNDWLNPDPDRLGFEFVADITFDETRTSESGTQSWTFPGVGTPVRAEWTDPRVTGNKNCYVQNGAISCEITIDLEHDVTDFEFSDVSVGMDIDPGTITWERNGTTKLDEVPDIQDVQTSESGFSFKFATLEKGSYKIRYTCELNESAGEYTDADKYGDRVSNTANWKWNGSKTGEDQWKPDYKLDTGGGSGDTFSKVSIGKDGKLAGNDGKDLIDGKYIRWEIDLNSNKSVDLAGYKLTDTLSGRHSYNFTAQPFTIEYMKDDGSTETYATWQNGTLNPTAAGTMEVGDDGTTFTFTFPDDATGLDKARMRVTYYTAPELGVDGKPLDLKVTNKAETWNPGDEEHDTKADTGDKTVDLRDPTATVTKSNPSSDNWNEGNGEVKEYDDNHILVPWTVTFDPSEELAKHANDPDWHITNLLLKEDWVSADSDGNTQHMWYSADTLDLKVYKQDKDGNWQLLEANAVKVSGNLDGNAQLPNTGSTFPKDWFENNDNKTGDGNYDDYTLHQGVPRFRIEFRDDRGNPLPIDAPVKITYYTIFDKTPDVYVNWAKFRYDAEGRSYDADPVSSEYVYGGKYQVGKSTDIHNYGKDYWDNTATRATCATKGVEAEGECFVTDWTVWANGPKPWGQPTGNNSGKDFWKEGISGAIDLTGKTVTFTDTLPAGWQVVPGSLKGYIVTPHYTDGKLDAATPEYVMQIDGLPESPEVTDSQFSVNVNLDGVACRVPDASGDTGGTGDSATLEDGSCGDLAHAIVKFTYSTYLTVEQAEADGYKLGDRKSYSNTATVTIGDDGGSATASTVVYKAEQDKGVLDKVMSQDTASTKKNEVQYEVTVNKAVQEYEKDYTGTDFFKDGGDALTLTDVLDPRAEFKANSLEFELIYTNGGGHEKPTVTLPDGSTDPIDNWKVDTSDWTVEYGTDTQSGSQTLAITIPKEFRMTKDWGDVQTATLVFDDHVGVRIRYAATVKGLPGQEVDGLTNTVLMQANVSYDYSTSHNVVIPTLTGAVWQSVTPSLLKTDARSGTKLAGAGFSLRKLDLSSFYTTDADGKRVLKTGDGLDAAASTLAAKLNNGDGLPTVPSATWSEPYTEGGIRYLESGSDGKVKLPNLSDHINEVFLLQEIAAPTGYELSTRTMYVVPLDPDQVPTDLNAILKAVNAKVLLAKNRINPLYPDTSNNLPVTNERIKDAVWGKVSQDESRIDEQQGTITAPEYIGGAEWKLSTENPDDPNEERVCQDGTPATASLLPCTVYIADNATTDGMVGDKRYVPDADLQQGRFKVKGLKHGVTYTLTETKAPSGYVLPADGQASYRFTLDEDGKIEWVGERKPYEVLATDGTSTGFYAIGNESEGGVILPSTGGTGAMAHLVAFGLALVAAGMALAVVNLRRVGRPMA